MIRYYGSHPGQPAFLGCDFCGEKVTNLETGMTWDEIARRVAGHNHNVPLEMDSLPGLDEAA